MFNKWWNILTTPICRAFFSSCWTKLFSFPADCMLVECACLTMLYCFRCYKFFIIRVLLSLQVRMCTCGGSVVSMTPSECSDASTAHGHVVGGNGAVMVGGGGKQPDRIQLALMCAGMCWTGCATCSTYQLCAFLTMLFLNADMYSKSLIIQWDKNQQLALSLQKAKEILTFGPVSSRANSCAVLEHLLFAKTVMFSVYWLSTWQRNKLHVSQEITTLCRNELLISSLGQNEDMGYCGADIHTDIRKFWTFTQLQSHDSAEADKNYCSSE